MSREFSIAAPVHFTDLVDVDDLFVFAFCPVPGCRWVGEVVWFDHHATREAAEIVADDQGEKHQHDMEVRRVEGERN